MEDGGNLEPPRRNIPEQIQFPSHFNMIFKTKTIKGDTKHSRKNVPKRRTTVRRIQWSFFECVFQGGPNSKVCFDGAIRIGLSEGASYFGEIGG